MGKIKATGISRGKTTDIHWFEGLNIRFKDPEYRIHPLMGYQVRSRHHFTRPTPVKQPETGHAGLKPSLTPYELSPEYVDKGERTFGEADLAGVKQYPVIIKSEPDYPAPDFSGLKTAYQRRAINILEFTIGYDHKSNKKVLYSPLRYNERWELKTQALWLRSIGMSPKIIGIKLSIPYDTVKTWMRMLKGQPLIRTLKGDWGTGYREEGGFRYFGAHSSVDAPKHTYSKDKGVDIEPSGRFKGGDK